MKYLILGSEGQIGLALTDYLTFQGHAVKGMDIKKDSFWEDLRNITRKKGDVQAKYFMEMLAWSDFVFFLSWDVGGAKYLESHENTFEFLDNNIQIMSNVFFYLKFMKKPFLFTSSQMSDMLNSVYGNTKLIGEKYTKALGGLCVKMWNVYGSYDFCNETDHAHVITDFIRSYQEQKCIKLLTDGEEKRQFLHVEDCCRALYVLSQNYNTIPRDKELHVTSFEWIKIKDLAEEVAKQLECEYVLGEKKDRVQNNHSLEPDNFIFNYWKPEKSLQEGIKGIIDVEFQRYLD